MQNYFEHFGIPIAYEINIDQLRKLYYQKSREIHPDLNLTEADQEFQTAFTNQAYKTLLNPLSRLKYSIELVSGPILEQMQALPQEFLIQMMELHESIFEAKEMKDSARLEQLIATLGQFESEANNDIAPVIKNFDSGAYNTDIIAQMKFYYFKLKYFLRLRENISNSENEIN